MNAPEKLKKPLRSASELTCIVRVNEEIKSIVATAFRINLMALNAIFLAKRAGNAALGFGVPENRLSILALSLLNRRARLALTSSSCAAGINSPLKTILKRACDMRASLSAGRS